MNVTLNHGNRQISSMRTAYFATEEGKNTMPTSTSDRDSVTISQEGRNSLEALADKAQT